MPTYCKRLIEVDLPIKRISAHARREKSIRHGHISTLHIWWARRPLAACRAVICAALWPDPVDPLCPQTFRDQAAELITAFARKTTTSRNLGESCSQESFGRWLTLAKPEARLDTTDEAHLNGLRYALLDFIADFSNWDNSTDEDYLETSRLLTHAAHHALCGTPGTRPLVVDPFAGGGSIPLEALRVGASVFATDLNPVAVLLNRVILEYIPKYGCRLADEVRTWGAWVKDRAELELAKFYPKDLDGATPVSYIWARTITCEGPDCGAEVPLIRSVSLASRPKRGIALRIVPNRRARSIAIEIEAEIERHPTSRGTVRQGAGTCPVCGFTTPVLAVRRQLEARAGGTADARLLAVITKRTGEQGRSYRVPTEVDLQAAKRAAEMLQIEIASHSGPLGVIPNEPTPPDGTGSAGGGYRTRKYGITTFSGFHTPRQLLEQVVLRRLVQQVRVELSSKPDDALAHAVHVCLALAADKQLDRDSAFCRWINQNEAVGYTFGRQAIPMLWDFVESPGLFSSGGWDGITSDIAECIEVQSKFLTGVVGGHAAKASATEHVLPDSSCDYLVTDPPYYDSVPYAELSDFFLVWLKRTLMNEDLLPVGSSLAPREQECVVNLAEKKDRTFFQRTMTAALIEGHRILQPSGVAVVVFAHKSTSGWEAQLQALIDAGWSITASWPLDTERPGRLRALDSAALSSSIHLVCRPRQGAIGHHRASAIGDWRDVLAELPQRIHEWMPRLAQEGVVGADAIFSCLGPALEIFSRYSIVEKASGERVTLRDYLEQVWSAVAKEALKMIFAGADATGFEEDARLTVIWFWVLKAAADNHNGHAASNYDQTEEDGGILEEKGLQSERKTSGYAMEYDAARKLAQGLGADMQRLCRPGGIVTIVGTIATLNTVAERERSLLGQQLSLFDDGAKMRSGKGKRRAKDPLAVLRSVENRTPTLFDQQPDRLADSSQPYLPFFKPDDSVRSLMTRLLDSGSTVLDRLHQAMLLFGRARASLLGSFLAETGMGNDQRFWLLAQSLSALYPSASDEKRWVDGVLARKKRLGF